MNRATWMIVGAVVLVLILKTLARPSASVREATKAKLAGGALVLDVRTAEEFADGHYPGATNIPLSELSGRLVELGDAKRAIVVYCRSGARSTVACRQLAEAGFRDVTNAGGLGDMPR